MNEVYDQVRKDPNASLVKIAEKFQLHRNYFVKSMKECRVIVRAGGRRCPAYKWKLSGAPEPITVRLCLATYKNYTSDSNKKASKKLKTNNITLTYDKPISCAMPNQRKVGFIRRQLFAVKNLILKIW